MKPLPAEQVKSSLAIRLTRAEKQALDLLAAGPLCTTEQIAGLMGQGKRIPKLDVCMNYQK